MTKLAIALIAAAPALMCPALAEPYISIKLFALVLAATMLWLRVAVRAHARTLRPLWSPLEVPVTMLLGVALISAALSVDPWSSWVGTRMFQFHSFLVIFTLSAIFAGLMALQDEADDGLFLKVTCACSCLVGACAAAQWMLGRDFLTDFTLASGRRVFSTWGGPVYLGAWAAATAPFCWLEARRGSRLGAAGMVGAVLAAACSGSRGAMVVMVFGGAGYYMAKGRVRPWVVAAATVAVLLAAALSTKPKDVARMELGRIALASFVKHPLFGSGPDTYALDFRKNATPGFLAAAGNSRVAQASAHNDVFQVLSTMGVLGLICWAFLLAMVAVCVAGSPGPLSWAVAGSALALFVQAKFNPVPPAAIAPTVAALALLRWGRRDNMSQARALGVCAPLLCGLAVTWQVLAAEYHVGRGNALVQRGDVVGSAVALNRAAQINPWDLDIRRFQLESLNSVTSMAPAGARAHMAQMSVRVARQAVRFHPNDPEARELLAGSLAAQVLHGAPESVARESLEQFMLAAELAPTYVKVLWRAHGVAEYLGDKAALLETESRMNAIACVTKEAPCRSL
jgi:O-antigen ligase